MATKFPNISYDLSQNIIYHGEMERLDNHSLVLFVVYCMKEEKIHEELGECTIYEEKNYDPDLEILLLDKYVREIRLKTCEYLRGRAQLLHSYVMSKIFFVLLQVCSFVKINKIYKNEERRLLLENLVFTSQGTINTKKTVFRVIENNDTLPLLKFKLAAQFFIAEKVDTYFFQLSAKDKEKLFRIDIKDFELCFWIWKLLHIPKRTGWKYFNFYENNLKIDLNNRYGGIEKVFQYIFEKAVEQHNEIAVHYMFTICITNIEKKYLIELIHKHMLRSKPSKFTHVNIIMYLVFAIKERSLWLDDLFDEVGYIIQISSYKIQRWNVVFLKVFRILKEHYNASKYYDMLAYIAVYNQNKDSSNINLSLLRDFYTEIPQSDKELLWTFNYKIVFYALLCEPFKKGNSNLVELFLESRSQKIEEFLISDYGIDLFTISILNSNIKFCNYILEKYLSNDQRNVVKNKILRTKAVNICSDLIFDGFHILNGFINLLTTSENTSLIREFGRNLPYINNGNIVKKTLFSLRKHDIYDHNIYVPDIFDPNKYGFNRNDPTTYPYIYPIMYTKFFLFWCVGKENVETVKSGISLDCKMEEEVEGCVIKCYENVCGLLLKEEYNRINYLMAWKLFTSKEKKQGLGIKLLNDKSLFEEMLKIENTFNYLYKFCRWLNVVCLINHENEDLKYFKHKVFKTRALFHPITIKFDVDTLITAINWCEPSEAMVLKFTQYLGPIVEKKYTNTIEALEKYIYLQNYFYEKFSVRVSEKFCLRSGSLTDL